MAYFKYKSAQNIEQLVSTLEQGKIWASDYKKLNDPMEWYFQSIDKEFDQDLLDRDKGNVKVCCLSRSMNYGLMWSMYADEHKGICLKVKVIGEDDISGKNTIVSDRWIKLEVTYQPQPYIVEPGREFSLLDALSIKSKQWEHEQEVRFARRSGSDCFLDVEILSVYLGERMPQEIKDAIYALKAEKKLTFDIIDMKSNNEGIAVNYWNDCNNCSYTS